MESVCSDRGRRPCLVREAGNHVLVYQKRKGDGHTIVLHSLDSDVTTSLSRAGVDTADLCAVGGDRVCAVWNELLDGRYVLFSNGEQGAECIVEPATSAIHPAMAAGTDGRIHLVYQATDDEGRCAIFYLHRIDGIWGSPQLISTMPGNNWCPAICVTDDGRVAIAWDGYAAGSYDIYLRFVETDGALSGIMRLTDDGCFHAHASLAPAAGGDVWVAWNRGTENWGQDNHPYRRGRILENDYLHVRRFLEVRRVSGNTVYPVFPDLQCDVLDMQLPGQHHERPQLSTGDDGRLHLTFRYNEGERRGGHRNAKRWQAILTSYNGSDWSALQEVLDAHGLSTGRISLIANGKDLLVAAAGEGAQGGEKNLETTVHVVAAASAGGPMNWATPPVAASACAAPISDSPPVPHRVDHQGEKLTVFFGDTHRHTEFSFCRTSIDGSLEEAYRYARDAAAMDFVMTADHDYQEQAPDMWLEVMQAADRYNAPGVFTGFFGYEWIGGSDNRRHRNIVSAERIPPPPFDAVEANGVEHRDAACLWRSLPKGTAVTIPHHTACGMSLLWGKDPGEAADVDYEPLVEIFQASRGSSEYIGAPTVLNHFSRSGEYRNSFTVEDGTVRTALRQGLRMGFIASSDHMSTHQSYACVYARENTRQALMEALLKRRTYAATDRIICEFRLADAFMGEEFATPGGDLPVVVHIEATGPIREVALLRDSEVYRTWEPSFGHLFDVTDTLTSDEAKGHYFYIRMQQEDTNLCWSSPIWVD